MKNKKGFTLIELLAVIVILGLLIAIAIPSISKYVTQSRKKTLATTISKYVDAGMISINNGEYILNDSNVIYAIPIECIPMERGGNNPFGEWNQVNNQYWAYVLVQYDPQNYNYNYGFTFKDSGGYGMYPTKLEEIDGKGKSILTNLELAQPRTGLATNFSEIEYWNESGFNVNSETRVKVLQSKLEGEVGDGENTCTLHNKGLNYSEIEEIRKREGTLVNSGANVSLVFGKEMDRNLIEEIYTLDYIDIPTNVIDSWDASIQKNESVMAYIIDKDKDSLYELYLAQEGGVIAPVDCRGLFSFPSATIMNLNKLDTSSVKNMSVMFASSTLLKKVELGSFDTSKVIVMSSMFNGCKNLISLDLSNFKTGEVTNMEAMFKFCSSLTSLNIGSFDTRKVQQMNAMFWGCSNLTSLDVSGFNTTNVQRMDSMFEGCSKIKYFDLSNFNTEKVTKMTSMFKGCENLTSLDLSKFDGTNVTTIASLFEGCKNLVSVDLSNFSTPNLVDINRMFAYCKSLKELDMSKASFANVTTYANAFAYGLPEDLKIKVMDTEVSFFENKFPGLVDNLIVI